MGNVTNKKKGHAMTAIGSPAVRHAIQQQDWPTLAHLLGQIRADRLRDATQLTPAHLKDTLRGSVMPRNLGHTRAVTHGEWRVTEHPALQLVYVEYLGARPSAPVMDAELIREWGFGWRADVGERGAWARRLDRSGGNAAVGIVAALRGSQVPVRGGVR